MSYLIQHSRKCYVNKDCPRGFCDDTDSATEFKTIFAGMQYLNNVLHEESIEEYKFIEITNIRKARHNVGTEINSNGRRWRTT